MHPRLFAIILAKIIDYFKNKKQAKRDKEFKIMKGLKK